VVNDNPQPLYARERAPLRIVQETVCSRESVWTDAENLALTGIRSPGRPARSKSLYRLSCPKYEQQALLNFRNLKGLYKTSALVSDIEIDVIISTKRCCLHEFILAAVNTNTVLRMPSAAVIFFVCSQLLADIHNCHTKVRETARKQAVTIYVKDSSFIAALRQVI
jgi:hypothetical protein